METLQWPHPIKAKKQHKCNFCDGIINPGETYIKSVHICDYIYTWKSHGLCSEICDKLKMYDNCDEGVTNEDFYEYINLEYENLIPDGDESVSVKKLTFAEKLDFVCKHHLSQN